ncbi:hypothetical protein NL676_014940 [Syzygium grande]|nr:hypothetical protein NL676_014940 [Syzygium grande]
MAVSSSPICSPLHATNTSSLNLGSPSPKLIWVGPTSRPAITRTGLVVFARKSGGGLASEDKRELLERYGLDPADFLSDASPNKARRRKDMQDTGRGKRTEQDDSAPPRTTHKLLQVLGGTARRKKLLSPKGMDVRPMMEVVKAAAFSILQAAGGSPVSLRPGRWLDLYSGTGSVGIEAISRGCSQVHFVEMDPWVVSDVLRPNLEWTGFLDASVIHMVRVEDFLEQAEQFVGKDGSFDYISVTPPYMQVDYGVLMDQISKSPLVGENSFVVVEYPLRTNMLDSCGCLVKITDRRFGPDPFGNLWA